jgi:hypothetical protein
MEWVTTYSPKQNSIPKGSFVLSLLNRIEQLAPRTDILLALNIYGHNITERVPRILKLIEDMVDDSTPLHIHPLHHRKSA